MLREKCIAANAYIKEDLKLISCFHLKKKEEQTKPNGWRNYYILEQWWMNKDRKTIEKIKETKSWFFLKKQRNWLTFRYTDLEKRKKEALILTSQK